MSICPTKITDQSLLHEFANICQPISVILEVVYGFDCEDFMTGKVTIKDVKTAYGYTFGYFPKETEIHGLKIPKNRYLTFNIISSSKIEVCVKTFSDEKRFLGHLNILDLMADLVKIDCTLGSDCEYPLPLYDPKTDNSDDEDEDDDEEDDDNFSNFQN